MTYTDAMRSLNDLKNQRKTTLDLAGAALSAKNEADYAAKMADAGGLNTQIEATQNYINELARGGGSGEPNSAVIDGSESNANLTDMLASNEYVNAFAFAIKNRLTPQSAKGVEDAHILLNALTETGGTPDGSNGGFLVPTDMQTQINELLRANTALSSIFHSESVSAPTGFRVYDEAPTKGMTKTAEMATIPKDDQPKFGRIPFSLEDYALIIAISNDLLADNTANLMAYLARWVAKKQIITENINLLGLLAALSPTTLVAGKELAGFKTAINETLDPAISAMSKIITNQSGFNFFDQMTDTLGRPLLQPDITKPTSKLLLTREVVVMPNAFLPNDATKGSPLFVGDFEQFGALMRGKNTELTTTNIGGDAWSTNSTEARAIARMHAITLDKDAAVKLFIPPAPKA